MENKINPNKSISNICGSRTSKSDLFMAQKIIDASGLNQTRTCLDELWSRSIALIDLDSAYLPAFVEIDERRSKIGYIIKESKIESIGITRPAYIYRTRERMGYSGKSITKKEGYAAIAKIKRHISIKSINSKFVESDKPSKEITLSIPRKGSQYGLVILFSPGDTVVDFFYTLGGSLKGKATCIKSTCYGRKFYAVKGKTFDDQCDVTCAKYGSACLIEGTFDALADFSESTYDYTTRKFVNKSKAEINLANAKASRLIKDSILKYCDPDQRDAIALDFEI